MTSKEISTGIANARKAFWSLKNILISKMMLKTKIQVLEMCVTPKMSNGCQTWSLTLKQTKKLKSTQYAMLRNIFNITLKR